MTPHPSGGVRHYFFDRYLLLPLGAIVALVWANTGQESYFLFAHRLSFAVNEIGMALFLGLVTQEIMEATLPGGALHTWRRWLLPCIAAAGGIAGAVFVFETYVGLKYEAALAAGWPVAIAVDIVAGYFILKAIFRRRSPTFPFMLLTAIVGNAVALTVIAFRGALLTVTPEAAALLVAAVASGLAFRWRRVHSFWPYLAVSGVLSWFAFYRAGLHPALALVPIVPLLPHRPRGMALLEDVDSPEPTRHFEHEWAYFVQPVVFLFGLVNAGVVVQGYGTGTWALLTAALVGRPAGILAAVLLATMAGLHLPERLHWRDLIVVAFATSGGFTLALFAATATYAMGPLLGELKVGALLTAAGLLPALGFARWLRVGRFAGHRPARREHPHAIPVHHQAHG